MAGAPARRVSARSCAAGARSSGLEINANNRSWSQRNSCPAANEYRVFYTAFEESVYVLHAFVKKTRKTSRADLSLGKTRYQEVLRQEASRKRGAPGEKR